MSKNVVSNVNFLGAFGNSADYNCEPYVVLPSTKNPRWYVPVKNRAIAESSLAVYQPSLLMAKSLKQLAILFARSGLYGLPLKNRIFFMKNDGEIRRIFNVEDLHYAIFAGTEGSHRKVTVQVMKDNGSILGYIKVSCSETIDRLLENETDALRYLGTLQIERGSFPQVIHYGEVNGTRVLVLDTLKGSGSTFSSRLSGAHIDFLAEVFRKTSQPFKFSESKFACGLEERLDKLNGPLAGLWHKRYQKAMSILYREMGNKVIPFGLCHRDFTPWNTFFHNNKLYVFDWEYAKNDYPPLLDVFHFIIQDGIQVKKLSPEKLLKKVMLHRPLINSYVEFLKVDHNLVDALLLCYLLDISMLYEERENGELRDSTARTIETWAGMMDLVAARI
jgi:hypothetical protein